MTTRDFTANVISATKVVPDGNFKDSKASGVWDINEALDLIKGGNWPNAANFSPSAFVDGLFSIDLYEGTNAQQTITNGVDLTKGGMLWFKNRDLAEDPMIVDSVRGGSKDLYPNENNAEDTDGSIASFNNNGFTFIDGANKRQNFNGYSYVSWTFREQPKFFDVVTYSSNQSSSQTINHNLGSVPGMIMVKRTSSAANWAVYHRGADSSNPEQYALNLNTNGARNQGTSFWNDTAPTSTQFTVGNNALTNDSDPADYVAYLFAHNNNDGGFGESADQDIIKCGYYTVQSGDNFIDLGFEPQFVILKNVSVSENWWMIDTMRGMTADGADALLRADTNDTEVTATGNWEVRSQGFNKNETSNIGNTYIYTAIRRGGMQTPTSASDVFQATASLTGDRQNGDTITTTLDHADWHFARRTGTSYAGYNQSRITGWNYLMTDAQDGEASATLKQGSPQNKLEYTGSWHSADSDVIDYFWKRARGFLDIVTYSGGSGADTISHNLGVTPEMIWVKKRTTQSIAARGNWVVYHSGVSNGYLNLHDNVALQTADAASKFGNGSSLVAPTSSAFTVADDYDIGRNGEDYIAFLMATAAGVSKVGTYTGNGSSQDIDCGFSGGNGASFVMIKNADATGSWVVFDTARGLVTGNDVYIRFDVTNAEGGGYDFIDPLESGFTINQTGGVVLNESGQKYIFWAIA